MSKNYSFECFKVTKLVTHEEVELFSYVTYGYPVHVPARMVLTLSPQDPRYGTFIPGGKYMFEMPTSPVTETDSVNAAAERASGIKINRGEDLYPPPNRISPEEAERMLELTTPSGVVSKG